MQGPELMSSVYCDPVLIKDGTLTRLYRVSRAGKYFIIKTAKHESGVYIDLINREYELSIGLSHPNIVSVFTFEEVTPVGPGIVMEYIDGCSLTEFLEQNPSRQLRFRVFGQLLEAVSYLHRKGIVHNDLKPENILISSVDNTLKIIDFGLSDNAAFYLYKNIGCTPEYASPELLNHQNVDCRSDIYSLGLIARDVLGDQCKRVWRKATSYRKEKRYANVEQMQRALTSSRRTMSFVGVFLIIAMMVLSFFIRRVEYRDSVTIVQDTVAVELLQMRNDSLQEQLDILKEIEVKRHKRKQFSDSVFSDIDKRMARIYLPLLDTLSEITYQDKCYELMVEKMLQLTDVHQSYHNITSDYELISAFTAYYTDLQTKYYNRCVSVIQTKPVSSTINTTY